MPCVQSLCPGLIELEKNYRGKQVQFLAIYANENEDLEQIAVHAGDRDFPFPVLKDSGQRLAELVGVTRVPTVAVLDGEFNLRYRGRVSDQYGVVEQTAQGDAGRPGRGARRNSCRPKGDRGRDRDGWLFAGPRACTKPAERGDLCQARGADPAKSLPGVPSPESNGSLLA